VKRTLLATAIVLACAACGGGGSSSAPTPAPTLDQNPKTAVLQPAAHARDTVDQLNRQQNQVDRQTGTAYNP
jgi:ABC-type glycerol-3-phosphate transport system substrate-binding protein